MLNRNAEGEGEEIFEERASESGNYSLTPPPPRNPSTPRLCQLTGSVSRDELSPQSTACLICSSVGQRGERPEANTAATCTPMNCTYVLLQRHTHCRYSVHTSSKQHKDIHYKEKERREFKRTGEMTSGQTGRHEQAHMKSCPYLIHSFTIKTRLVMFHIKHMKLYLKCNLSNGILEPVPVLFQSNCWRVFRY